MCLLDRTLRNKTREGARMGTPVNKLLVHSHTNLFLEKLVHSHTNLVCKKRIREKHVGNINSSLVPCRTRE